ncbi:hypothetical protein BG004_006234 [Podila humilis]|nr:hypothetical protein BG004_006234 [Podila humilis]
MSQQATSPEHPDSEWAPTARRHEPRQKRSSSLSLSTPTDNKDTSKQEESDVAREDDDDEDEEDEYEKRIERTGCSAENETLQNCYMETHDWRQCKDAMEAFRDCWKRNGNVEAE